MTALLTLGRFLWMSTGLPNVITEAIPRVAPEASPSAPRYAAAWYANIPPCE